MNEFENNQNPNIPNFNAVNEGYSPQNYNAVPDFNTQTDQYSTPSSYAPPEVTPPIFNQSFENEYQKPPKVKKEKKNHGTGTVIVACLLAAVIGATSGIAAMWVYFKTNNSVSTSTKTESGSSQASNGTTVNITVDESVSSIAEAVAAKCNDSVVGIRTTSSVSDFFGGRQEQSGEGSGVIYTADGYIITNYHVISDAVESSGSKIEVFLGDSNSESYPAEVIGYNISCDLAVIKIDEDGLTPLKLADSDELKTGQYVVTIGAPGGLDFMGSVTYGIISGLNRKVSADSQLELIQIDAAINPGNSGGALLNSEGELIGINSSKIVSEEFEGMGFAIPSNAVKEKCDKIIARNGEDGVYLGVSISRTYTAEVLSYYGYPSGAVVSSVSEDSPADKAGIERGDIITEFAGVTISEYTVLNDTLYDCEPGDTVEATIYRSGRYYTVKITLASDGS